MSVAKVASSKTEIVSLAACAVGMARAMAAKVEARRTVNFILRWKGVLLDKKARESCLRRWRRNGLGEEEGGYLCFLVEAGRFTSSL